MPLKRIIGDSRIVMLGEISHGDGTTFLAKSRLIKLLHQQMNFDVLVFESGFYDMSKVWESIQQGQDPVAAVQGG
jgi:erythromycin esterase